MPCSRVHIRAGSDPAKEHIFADVWQVLLVVVISVLRGQWFCCSAPGFCSDPSGIANIHSRSTTGDCVVTECPENYRVLKVGTLGKHLLPSANTRKT